MEIAVDPKLLEILVCPLTKTTLTYDRQNNRLISEAAGLAYPILKGVPIMLIDGAEIIDEIKANEFRGLFSQRNP
ncbi:MAG: Trm112 family protein [Candidatus Paracaedibacteraceae bacterium]|nr:Trm112 family protein [Candidatus Paracaedibacteraceae bacterium]